MGFDHNDKTPLPYDPAGDRQRGVRRGHLQPQRGDRVREEPERDRHRPVPRARWTSLSSEAIELRDQVQSTGGDFYDASSPSAVDSVVQQIEAEQKEELDSKRARWSKPTARGRPWAGPSSASCPCLVCLPSGGSDMVFRPVIHLVAAGPHCGRRGRLRVPVVARAVRKHVMDVIRRSLIVVTVIIMGAGPSIPGEAVEVTSTLEVYFVIDRTGSMAAEDWDGAKPRIDGVRNDVALTHGHPSPDRASRSCRGIRRCTRTCR